jgi:hypothetical protein
MDVETYLPLIILAILLTVTYVVMGIEVLASNIFMLSIYSMFVPILFFTYGAYIEKQIVRSQVTRLIDNFTSDATKLGYTIPKVTFPVPDSEMDQKVKKLNKEIMEEAFIYLSVGFIAGVALSVVLWKYAKTKFNFKHLAYENFALLLLVAITEIAFFGIVSRNYRTLDANEVKRFMLTEIAKKLQ